LLAASLDLAAYYGERDLAPLDLASKNAASRAHELIDGTGVSSYVEDLREHSNLLALERDRLREHAATLQHERVHQLGHIANLEDARGHLVAHVANLESEHAHVAGHAANLERELAELRTHRTLRQLLILRVRRMLGMSAVPRAATVAHRAAASPIASEERGA
jgi:chromosome segregation ATPase